MKKYIPAIFLSFLSFGLIMSNLAKAVEVAKIDSAHQLFYVKKEINKGLLIHGQNEREGQTSDDSNYSEKLYIGYAGFQLNNQVWNFLRDKQEMMNVSFDAGPFFGSGNGFESNPTEEINADLQLFGIRAGLEGNYESRFYYDHKTYTLVQVNAWVRNDLLWKNSIGNQIDSNQVISEYNKDVMLNRLRYGFNAKAGWGFGRLNPMNHYMVADYVLKNYYKRRVFSEKEKERLAAKIGQIKQSRNPGIDRSVGNELLEMNDFLRSEMMLEAPGFSEEEWVLGEFLPRYSGARLELGPFFNYYNREPDFYYGGFLQYKNDMYKSFNWNRNISLEASYSHYKKQDWANIVADFGWSYFPNLKTQFSFGLKYIPGVVIYSLKKMDPVRHNFIPYLEYFTQVNEKARMNFSFAWRISDGEDFMMSGPEFSLSFYRSSY